MENMLKGWWNRIISIFFGIALVLGITLLLVRNWDEFVNYKELLRNIPPWYLLVIMIITVNATLMRTWRWYYLLIPLKQDISWRNILRVTINALAANYSTPGKLGIPAKAILLKESEKIPISHSLPSILGELFIEYSTEALLAIGCVIIGGHYTKVFRMFKKFIYNSNLSQMFLFFGALVIILIGIGYLLRHKVDFGAFWSKLVDAIRVTGKRRDCIWWSYIITMINVLLSYFANWLLFAALGHPEIEFTFVLFAGTITNIVGLLSPLPGGIGFRELTIFGLYDFYFGLGSIALLMILITRVITYAALLLLFLIEKVAVRRRKTLVTEVGFFDNDVKGEK